MGISGNLKTMVLAELLQWLSMGQKTGTLVIENQGKKITKRVFFDDGVIISSASTDPKEYLGRFLASHGFIPEETVNEALANQKKERQLLGKILVNMGAISEEDLHQMLRLKAEESIYDIFTWEEGEFEFLDDQLPEETMIKMQLDVQGIVLEGTRRVDEWSRIREVIPSDLAVPVTVVESFDDLELDDIDRTLLDWIDDDRSVEDISNEAQISLFAVATVIAQQVQEGRVKVVRPRIIEVEVRVPIEDADGPKTAAPAEVPPPGAVPQHGHPMPQMMQPPPQYAMPPMYAQQPMQGYPAQQAPGAPPVSMPGGRTLHFASNTPGGNPLPGPAPTPAAPAPSSEAERLLLEAQQALDRGELDKALKTFRQAKEAPGNDSGTATVVETGEGKIRSALERAGVAMSSVPKLRCGMEELTKLDISPQEGFMLTRVDGSFDIKSILKMSPMPAIDAQMLFWKLKQAGHVDL